MSLIKRTDGYKNSFEKICIAKVGEHIPCGYSVFTIWMFDITENIHDVQREQDSMKTFYESL